MKKLLLLITTVVLLFSCKKEPQLIWEENFNGDSLNNEIWNFELGDGCPDLCGWGNNEAQIYTKTNSSVKDGMLTITAKYEDSVYTSTKITTKGKYELQYGKIEMRAKLAVGKGLWPAFWMLGSNINEVGWPKCGEIDILEYVGREPNTVFSTLHTPDSFGNTKNTKKLFVENIEEGFHIYTANWTKDSIEFFVDDQLIYHFIPENKTEEVWPFSKPFYFIINMAIGGNFGGHDIDNSVFPQEYVIDYIKVYKN